MCQNSLNQNEFPLHPGKNMDLLGEKRWLCRTCAAPRSEEGWSCHKSAGPSGICPWLVARRLRKRPLQKYRHIPPDFQLLCLAHTIPLPRAQLQIIILKGITQSYDGFNFLTIQIFLSLLKIITFTRMKLQGIYKA